jgi:hypothetical protein
MRHCSDDRHDGVTITGTICQRTSGVEVSEGHESSGSESLSDVEWGEWIWLYCAE